MKQYLFYSFIFLMFSVNHVYGNDNSAKANERIKAFVQVWGLVKYKSLNGAQGKFNADSVFLALLGKVNHADANQFSELMIMLLKENPGKSRLNEIMVNKENTLTKNIDYTWIKDKIFKDTIQKQLTALSMAYNPNSEHYFIPKVHYDGNIPHENPYPAYTFDNEAMNLLALAKAWNAVNYLFAYRYLMDQKWELTLEKLIPIFQNIKSRAAYEKSILLLESAIDDTHAAGFLSQVKHAAEIFDLKYYPPFAYKIYQDKLLITAFLNDSLAKTNSLKVGDLIVAINGMKTNEWLKQRSALLPASNLSVKNRLLANTDALAFSALSNGTLAVRVKRGNKDLDLNLVLLDRRDQQVPAIVNTYFKQIADRDQLLKGYEELTGDIALIRAGYFFDKDLPAEKNLTAFSQSLNKKKAIIFDMRKYPSAPGLFYYYLPMALGKPAFKFAQYYGADLSNPGVFSKQDGLEIFLSKDIKTEMPLYEGKIVILTNEYTQSMGEWYTMFLRQVNANTTVIGSQTAGTDGDVKHLNLPGGYEFLFTGNGIFYPNGKQTQRIGILPDLLYQPNESDLLSSTDQQLEKALEYLKNK
jgi:carboxyl-terminal processing protease